MRTHPARKDWPGEDNSSYLSSSVIVTILQGIMKCKGQQLVGGSTSDKHSTRTFIHCGVQRSLLI